MSPVPRLKSRVTEYPFLWRFDPDRYATAYLCSRIHEAQVVAWLLDALRRGWGAKAWPVDVGAKTLRGRAVGALRRRGVARPEQLLHGTTGAGMAGLPDIQAILPGGQAVLVEAKAPAWLKASGKTGRMILDRAAGAPDPTQLAFLTDAHAHGALVGCAWAVTDLFEILGPPPRRLA
ncbi:MAG: hypothetical protein IPL32_19205 [Chloracidobacterium sp.]|nr:hypothetical protein [Chloracidobacterium sp.]